MVVLAVLACADGAGENDPNRYCDLYDCPATIEEALSEVYEDSDARKVAEFGTVCVGWFDVWSGVAHATPEDHVLKGGVFRVPTDVRHRVLG